MVISKKTKKVFEEIGRHARHQVEEGEISSYDETPEHYYSL